MSAWEDELLDEFLREAAAAPLDEPGPNDAALARLLAALEPEPLEAPADLRAQLQAEARHEGRFDRFREIVAELMDVDLPAADALLDGIGDPASWEASPLPQVSLYHLQGGPAVENAITGFVRIRAGDEFPEHVHLGDEEVLVIQGSFVDGVSGAIFRAGDRAQMRAGTRHDFRVRPGPDLIYLVVLQEGLTIGDQRFGPNDPGM